jgi:phage terminase Nu1 subunit (DNA packaging protein)
VKLFKILGGIIAAIAGIAGMLFASGKKSQEVNELKTVIKKNKKEITTAKRKLTNSKKKTQKMEKAYEEDDVESAEDFLKNFAKNK